MSSNQDLNVICELFYNGTIKLIFQELTEKDIDLILITLTIINDIIVVLNYLEENIKDSTLRIEIEQLGGDKILHDLTMHEANEVSNRAIVVLNNFNKVQQIS
jgi:hypothetical protein